MRLGGAQGRGVLLVILAASAGVIVGILGLLVGSQALAVFGGLAAMWLPVAAALFIVVAERRRHEVIEGSLQAQATFLERLVESMSRIAEATATESLIEKTAAEAQSLFAADSVRVFANDEPLREVAVDGDAMVIPIRSDDASVQSIELRRAEPFTRTDEVRATVIADFSSGAAQKAGLLTEARKREAERARLTEQVITAEQDERRRLSLFLHDGPLQQMSGIALMHDAALAALEDERYEDAAKVVTAALERERTTIRTLRDLSFSIEPLVLRDHGFSAAVQALGDQVRSANGVDISISVEAGEEMGEKCQAAVYQIMRDAITQAVRRKPQRIEITLREVGGGSFETTVTDDGVEEKRHASLESIEERVGVLNGRFAFSTGDDGTVVRVSVPAYVAAAAA